MTKRGVLRQHEVTGPTPDRFDAGIWFIGRIRTPWTRLEDCPKRGDPADGPECHIELDPLWEGALNGVAGKERLQILYWMDRARRDVLAQNPSFGDHAIGTFALRSPLRPNPIASSITRLVRVEGNLLTVRGLDCLDGTPLVDIKPEFGALK